MPSKNILRELESKPTIGFTYLCRVVWPSCSGTLRSLFMEVALLIIVVPCTSFSKTSGENGDGKLGVFTRS